MPVGRERNQVGEEHVIPWGQHGGRPDSRVGGRTQMAASDRVLMLVSRPLYAFAEADRLANVTRGTAKRWLIGYGYRSVDGKRVAKPAVVQSVAVRGVSFADLVEVVAIGRLRELGFSLALIRKVVANCREMFNADRLFSSLRFKAGGREVFVERDLELIEVGRKKGMQAWDSILAPFLETLDDTEGIATAWWPLGREHGILVDPAFAFGLPIIAGTAVRTEIVLERFQAGEFADETAEDLRLSRVQVERALQFEMQRAA